MAVLDSFMMKCMVINWVVKSRVYIVVVMNNIRLAKLNWAIKYTQRCFFKYCCSTNLSLINQNEKWFSVQPSREQHIVLLLSCQTRDRSCATDLHSLAPHILDTAPPLISLSFTLPPLSVTAHIWFWVKARLVSSGMEGFYFSMAPLPLQFHSPVCVRACSLFTNRCSFSIILILLSPRFHYWGTPQSSPINGQREQECRLAGGLQGFPVAPS